jgi:hypothetical protein
MKMRKNIHKEKKTLERRKEREAKVKEGVLQLRQEWAFRCPMPI